MAPPEGWAGLFSAAFLQSRNGMVLVDDSRRHVDANGAYLKLLGQRKDAVLGRPVWEFVADGPLMSPQEWAAALAVKTFTGEAELIARDGSTVGVQWGATTEVVTGRRRSSSSPSAPPDGAAASVAASTRTPRSRRCPTASVRSCASSRPAAPGQRSPIELRLAPHTVQTHVRNAMTKTGARSRAHLVAKAIGDALMEP